MAVSTRAFEGFAANLRRFRLERRWSQTRLAVNANVVLGREYFEQSYISALENGLAPRSETHVLTLAKALGVTRAQLERRRRIAWRPEPFLSTPNAAAMSAAG